MACVISYRDNEVPANNMQFASLIDFALDVADASCADAAERAHVERLKRMQDEEFFPGRNMDIEKDFPSLEERKFWCRVFFDTARAVVERRIGVHEYVFWQAQRIWQLYGAARLFEQSVHDIEPLWTARTLDTIDFHRIVNKTEI